MSLAAHRIAQPIAMPPAEWDVLISNDGEPIAAFLRGHRDISVIAPKAEAEIVASFASYSAQLASDVIEILDEAGGAGIRHDWLRMTAEDIEAEFFEFCQQSASGAFPVTAVRFQ